ncbi:cyclin-D3-2 [Pyrus ussuriensis x Pyrus communis]|uniref:B-like cyclin n=1 Tax=Pyrus ussuriensis x Pyrus communis TaxID=2448454 RepID=A0A5N5ICJ7_9ROSA|nr:cyclin-D3-2 [Pyrus ussuriensis x Pyrus communis]
MALQEEPKELQNPPMAFDPSLFCEEGFEEDLGDNGSEEESENCDGFSKKQSSFFPLIFLESDIGEISDGSLMAARKEVVKWILSVKAHYGFSSLTAILAVNYFDRFIASRPFQKGKQWMSQLAAIACISLAAKVEETHVPLFLDLQIHVEETKYVLGAIDSRVGGKGGSDNRRSQRQHGAEVIITDVQDNLGHSVRESIGPSDCTFVHYDVTDEAQIKNAVHKAVAAYGKLDIMFNNAGIAGQFKPRIIDNEKLDFEPVLSTNITGVFLWQKACRASHDSCADGLHNFNC